MSDSLVQGLDQEKIMKRQSVSKFCLLSSTGNCDTHNQVIAALVRFCVPFHRSRGPF